MYDSKGRINSIAETIAGPTFSTTFTYDGIGRLSRLVDRPVNIQDLPGSGYSLKFGLAFLGYSLGNNGYVQEGEGFHYVPPTYRSIL